MTVEPENCTPPTGRSFLRLSSVVVGIMVRPSSLLTPRPDNTARTVDSAVASGSITAADNDGDFAVVLPSNGQHIITVYWNLGAAATVVLEGRNPDGLNTWIQLETYDTTTDQFDTEDTASEPYNAYAEHRVSTDTDNIDETFELSVTR